jgi:oligosaccharide repeat unit polymerase
MTFMLIFIFFYYATRRVSLKTVLVFFSLCFIVIYSIANVRGGVLGAVLLYKASSMRIPVIYAFVTEPYMYIVMNVENMVRSINLFDHYTLGYYSLDSIFALTGLKHWVAEYFGIIDTPFLVSGYNTYTIFWNFYRDFGTIGISFVPLLYGFMVGCIYHLFRCKPTIGLSSLYGMSVFMMFFSFFINPLGYLWFVYICVCIFGISKLINTPARYAIR